MGGWRSHEHNTWWSNSNTACNLQYKRQMNREMAEGLKQMVDDEKEKKEREEEEARRKKEADLLLPGAAEAAAAAELKRLKVGSPSHVLACPASLCYLLSRLVSPFRKRKGGQTKSTSSGFNLSRTTLKKTARRFQPRRRIRRTAKRPRKRACSRLCRHFRRCHR